MAKNKKDKRTNNWLSFHALIY